MIESFTFNAHPARVIFGSGTLSRLGEEIDRLGIKRALFVATPAQARDVEAIATSLGDRTAGVFAGAAMHTPVDVTERALTMARAARADGLVAIGGGSTTGLAKALACRTDLPQLIVPTTYAGSEMTPILGETENGRKTTHSSARILPETVIYDVDLTLTLPPAAAGTSGLNAIAHAVEALYARDRNPIISLVALDGITALHRALPRVAEDPRDIEARSGALYGAWLCGMCLGAVGMALHHKLCHTLGGSFDLPHAETHAIILPHALAYNAPVMPDVIERLGQALRVRDPARELYDLGRRMGAPAGLRDLGMPEASIEQAVLIAQSKPYWNPQPITAEGIRDLIGRAWVGEPPLPLKAVAGI